MKILIITNHLNGTDGWSRYSADLVQSFTNAGHEVECCVAHQDPLNPVTQHLILGEPLLYVTGYFLNIRTAIRVSRVCKTFLPDIVHFFVEPYANIISFLPEFQSHPRYFITGHGTYSYVPETEKGVWKLIARSMYDKALRKADGVICVSEYTKRHLLSCAHHSFSGTKISVITNGTGMSPQRNTKKGRDEKLNILFVGAVKARKGLSEALRGLSLFQQKYKQTFTFNIVGAYDTTGPYFKSLEKLIAENLLTKSVVFQGKVSDEELSIFYSSADVFLMTPISSGVAFEGFGLVYIEANAYGTPCIGSKDSGASEAIIDGKTGYLVDAYNPDDIADALHNISEGKIDPADCRAWTEKNSVQHKSQEIITLYTNRATSEK